jgi:internalin A
MIATQSSNLMNMPSDVVTSILDFVVDCESANILRNVNKEMRQNMSEHRMKLVYIGLRDLDVSKVTHFHNVHRLSFISCTIDDLSPIRNLTNLESLVINSCHRVTDISFISDLVGLCSLYICDNKYITNVSSLANLPKLKYLNLRWLNNLEDITALGNITTLKQLNLGATDIKSIYPISNLMLTKLDLYLTKIQSIVSIRNMPLVEFNISNCRYINDRHTIGSLTKLTKLSYEPFGNSSWLSNLTNLNYLTLSGAYWFDLSQIVNLPIVELRVSCELNNIGHITCFKKLKKLYMVQYSSNLSEIRKLLVYTKSAVEVYVN